MQTQIERTIEGAEGTLILFHGQKTEDSGDNSPELLPELQITPPGRTYTFPEAAALLELGDESNLRNWYWKKKIRPAFQHCPYPLQSIARYDSQGNPTYRLNENAITVLKAFLLAKSSGRDEEFLMEAREKYPAPMVEDEAESQAEEEPETLTKPNVAVETKAAIVLEAPCLPSAYSLTNFQSTDAIELDDPLALAQQFLEAADFIQGAMQQDIQQREQKLQQTKQARNAIAAKAQELKLEQRFYQERANQVSAAQTEETQALQEALGTLQGMGKPSVPASQAG